MCTRIVVSSSVRNIAKKEGKAKHNESKEKRKDRQEKRMEKREDRKQKRKERKETKKHRQVRRRSKKSSRKRVGIPRSKRDLVKGMWGRKRGTYRIVA